MTTKRKLLVFAILVVHTIAVMIGTRMIWPSDNQQVQQIVWTMKRQDCFVCPPRPSYKTEFAIGSYYSGTGRITFNATEDMAASTEEFGWLVHDFEGYTLYVDHRYDFQEVLDYLEFWGECHEMVEDKCYIWAHEVSCDDWDDDWETAWPMPTPTPTCDPYTLYAYSDHPCLEEWDRETTVEPTPTPTPDAFHRAIKDDKCYVWAHEVSCDVWETTLPTPTPTPAPVPYATDYGETCAVEDGQYYVVPTCSSWDGSGTLDEYACPIEQGYPVDVKTYQECLDIAWGHESPTPTPTLVTLFFDESNDWSVFPEADWTFEFDWSGNIHITDALSQTTSLQGPVTVRFSDEEIGTLHID